MAHKFNPDKHHRRSIRLKGYDYRSTGAYFVTICTHNREHVLDDPVVGGIIVDVWHALPQWFPTIAPDEFVVMPNHVHLIVWLQQQAENVGTTLAVAPDAVTPDAVAPDTVAPDAVTPNWVIPTAEKTNPNPTLGDVIGAFKSLVFTVYLDWIQVHDPVRRAKFWQRNYYEHIIRNRRELQAIRRYIRDNPARWELDRDNPKNFRRLRSPTRIEDYLADIQALIEDENDEG